MCLILFVQIIKQFDYFQSIFVQGIKSFQCLVLFVQGIKQSNCFVYFVQGVKQFDCFVYFCARS
jgi:hypothetical protein